MYDMSLTLIIDDLAGLLEVYRIDTLVVSVIFVSRHILHLPTVPRTGS
jgi:hypothetical protein